MDYAFDTELAEMLVSRMAHELAGAVGGVNNGLELLGDEASADELSDEILTHTSNGARVVADRLAFYRMAYGAAGRSLTSFADVRATAMQFSEACNRGRLDWPMPPVVPTFEPGVGKLALLLVEIAFDALTRDGVIAVAASDQVLAITITGQSTAKETSIPELSAAISAALVADSDAGLSVGTAHAVLARRVAVHTGRVLEIEEHGGGDLRLVAQRRA